MPDAVNELSNVAAEIHRAKSSRPQVPVSWDELGLDPYLTAATEFSFFSPKLVDLGPIAATLLADDDLSPLLPEKDELDVYMTFSHAGGSRIQPGILVYQMLVSAFRQIYFLNLQDDEPTFVRLVVEAFEELKRAVRGEQVRLHQIFGLTGISLASGCQVTTPWGVVRPARDPNAFMAANRVGGERRAQSDVTAVLAIQRLTSVAMSREPHPHHELDLVDMQERQSPALLVPLSFALATRDRSKVPDIAWQTDVFPFLSMLGSSSPNPFRPPRAATPIDVEGIRTVEEWARIVSSQHVPNVDVAARRLVQALIHRWDRADVLIDSVMVWENLVGTSTETTFRVTAALAKLLEGNVDDRRALRSELDKIYGVRSRVVHGDAVDALKVDRAATRALEVAIASLASSYRRGVNWLSMSSTERADAIILEER